MKLDGKSIVRGPKVEVAVVVRPASSGPDGKAIDNNFYFQAQAILDFTPLDTVLKEPKPPMLRRPNQPAVPNLDDPEYKLAMVAYDNDRTNWMVWNSLQLGTKNLEWETVSPSDRSTWVNWRQELKQAGLNDVEIQTVMNAALMANSFNPDLVEQARNHFLAGNTFPNERST